MSGASPLGRYAPDSAPAPDQLVTVHLLGVPLRLLLAGREHHDSLMREFRLLALEGRTDGPARLVELTQLLGVRYGSAAARRDGDVDAALGRGEDSADLSYEVPREAAAPLQELDRLMSEVDELCRQEQLLTVARTPAVQAFASWYLQQFIGQIEGRPPERYAGPREE